MIPAVTLVSRYSRSIPLLTLSAKLTTTPQDDLQSFRAHHFNFAAPPSAPPPQQKANPPLQDPSHHLPSQTPNEPLTAHGGEEEKEEEEEEEYGDDGLGFYPDGVKRTLTYEQVAIFRHSELQNALKQRRYERMKRLERMEDEEAEEAEEEERVKRREGGGEEDNKARASVKKARKT